MTHRERFMAVLRGERPDRIPVFPTLDFWHKARQSANDWPPGLEHAPTLDEITLSLDMGLAKFARVFKAGFREPASYRAWREGLDDLEEWRTPAGVLRRVRRHNPEHDAIGMKPHPVRMPIAEAEDYPVFIDLMQHLEFTPDPGFKAFRDLDRRLGENGVALTNLSKSPTHDMMLKWIGYENAYCHMADHPDLFQAAAEAANAAHRRAWDILAESPCKVIMQDGNFSAMTPPPVFRKYLQPYLTEFNARMHEAGKLVISHTDGDMTGLLEMFRDCGFDGTNSHACAPLVPCALEDAARVWKDRVTIWGAMPSILLEPTATDAEFQAHLRKILEMASDGARIIVGVSDHAMPAALYDRIVAMARFFSEHGAYPIRLP